MPWQISDVDSHMKGLSPKQKRQWVAVANSALAKCQKEGGKNCDVSAIQQANGVVGKTKEAALPETDEILSQLQEAANIGNWLEARLHLAFTEIADSMFGDGRLTRDERIGLSGAIGDALDSFNQAVTDNLPQLYQRDRWQDPNAPMGGMGGMMEAAVTKTDGGETYTAADYLYVPDPQKPSEWKLRIAEYVGGKKQVTAAQVGRAIAALSPGGFRGNKVQIPANELGAIKSKLRRLWNRFHGKDETMPAHIKEAQEPEELEIGYIALVEGAVRRDGTVPLKLIAPGWGSSGYYPPEVLQRDGPRIFTKGTKQYWDHPTAQQEAERPEGSLRDLAAELIDNARYDENGPAGPGLYANAKVFGPYKEAINELAPHIGVSIRAQGPVQAGMAEGREGRIVQGITSARSVDFVTAPGAGGQIVSLFEAARGRAYVPESEEDVNEQQFKEAVTRLEEQIKTVTAKNEELTQANARLTEAQLLREAADFARPLLGNSQLPGVTQERLLTQLSANPPIAEGKLDHAAYTTRIQEAITGEMEYLRQAAGYGSGAVRGMGSSEQSTQALQEAKDIQERMATGFARMGMSENGVKQAVRGRD